MSLCGRSTQKNPPKKTLNFSLVYIVRMKEFSQSGASLYSTHTPLYKDKEGRANLRSTLIEEIDTAFPKR